MTVKKIKVPVVVGDGIPEILIGLSWLENRCFVVDKKAGILTLEYFCVLIDITIPEPS
ncbi:hypothetical protein [Okeania sp. KiyG1]|uniref:hypothetical protein n=1 Tax=Okeania sp. KiyG1 TaxID=2720165 RepID=UPI001920DD6E|nr:hypothetical protein [Okeania sp. KiyG1]